jgi:hypothetical protein
MVMCVGQVVATRGVAYDMEEDKEFERFVRKSFSRHASGDWGDLCEEDKAHNDYAIENGERVFSSYNYNEGTKIWIITEWDRSATTILFPEEY